MATRLYIEKVGPDDASLLEVKVNTEARVLKINGEQILLSDYAYISGPEYRDGKFPTINIRYEMQNEGIKKREETIRAIKEIKNIKVRELSRDIYSIVKIIRDENDNPIEFIQSKNKEIFPFLEIVFPKMTRISVANYYI